MVESIDPASRRRVLGALMGVEALMVVYWTLWFLDRSVVASNQRDAYMEFENAFPAADGLIVVLVAAAAVALSRRHVSAFLWLVAGGGAGLYLFCLDVLYDLEHGIWWRSGAGGVIELAINVLTLAISLGMLRWSWRRRQALLAGR